MCSLNWVSLVQLAHNILVTWCQGMAYELSSHLKIDILTLTKTWHFVCHFTQFKIFRGSFNRVCILWGVDHVTFNVVLVWRGWDCAPVAEQQEQQENSVERGCVRHQSNAINGKNSTAFAKKLRIFKMLCASKNLWKTEHSQYQRKALVFPATCL